MPQYPSSSSAFNNLSIPVAEAPAVERAAFVRVTYIHVAVSLAVFAMLEAILIDAGMGVRFLEILGASRFSWLVVLGVFMGVSWIADKWARSSTSLSTQYAGLGLFIVVEAIVFLPLLTIASLYAPETIGQAAVITAALVAGITAVAFVTRKNFSFLGPMLGIAGMVAMGTIVAAILFGFNLGLLFTSIMILFAGASVLYSTSNILHEYSKSQYVAAALSLFASIALLFFYVLRFILAFGRD